MADIVIHFTIEGGGDAVPTPNEENKDKKKEDGKYAFTLDEARSVAKRLAGTVANNMVSTIGSKTGNYVLQERMQYVMSFSQRAVSVASSFAANVYLGIANLVIQGVDMGFDYANQARQIRWNNREKEQLARRAGYNSNYNR